MGRSKILGIMIIALAATTLAACGSKVTSKGGSSFPTACEVPDEQANAFLGEWSQAPIKIAYYNGSFTAGEKGAIQSAVESWNSFYSVSKGFSLFEISGSDSNLNQVNANCGGAPLADGTVLYKRYANWTRLPTAAAVTSTCTSQASASSAFPRIFNAIMEFNYQSYFTTAKRTDLESIALHELGHLMGLDHACDALKNKKANVACPAGDPSDDIYVQAVMYPKVFHDSSGEGEIKRTLTKNDMGRANCLYNSN